MALIVHHDINGLQHGEMLRGPPSFVAMCGQGGQRAERRWRTFTTAPAVCATKAVVLGLLKSE